MTDLTTRIKHSDLPASRPPVEPERPQERAPYVPSTADRDPFEVLGIKDPLADPDADIPF